MQIDYDHMYYGAALTQIAEHPNFTAINAFNDWDASPEGAYRINDEIAIYVKYASKPAGVHKEYLFTFTTTQLSQLEELARRCAKTFVVLVCIKARHICVLTLDELKIHIARRKAQFGSDEDQYLVLVTLPEGKSFRIYTNKPHTKNVHLKEQIVARNKFPAAIFD